MRWLLNLILVVLLLSPPASAKDLITPSDFSFIGGFSIPADADFLNGVTLRRKDGSLYMYSIDGAGANVGTIYEIPIPGTLDTTKPYDAVSNYVSYGDIYQDKIVDLNNNSNSGCGDPPFEGLADCASPPGAIFWDEDNSRMYWTKTIGYENPVTPATENPSIGYATLNDTLHTGTGIGTWKVDTAAGGGWRWVVGMLKIPSDFSTAYLSGRRYALFGGGAVSIVAFGSPSLGPIIGVLPHAPNLTDEDHLDFISSPPEYLVSHTGPSNVADLPTSITLNNQTIGDALFGNTTTFSTTGSFKVAVWISSTNKEGILFLGHTGGGNTNTTITSVTSKSEFTVASIGDIVASDCIQVANGTGGSYPWEDKIVASVNGNTITLTSAMTEDPAIGGAVVCGEWYSGGGPWTSRAWHPYMIYSPADFAEVVANTKEPSQLPPASSGKWTMPETTYPLPGGFGSGSKDAAFFGGAFDDVDNRLYLMDRSAGGGKANVYVFQLNDTTPTPTCSDGVQNGDETGVDCGGSCPACQGSGGGAGFSTGAGRFATGAGRLSW
jgi:hypothetical protein